jgi:hypothetical protein
MHNKNIQTFFPHYSRIGKKHKTKILKLSKDLKISEAAALRMMIDAYEPLR